MLRSTVAALHAVADELAGAQVRLSTADPGAAAFGADGLGLLGEVGREAHLRYRALLDARAREAGAHAQRLRELAGALDRASRGLADAESSASRSQRESDAELP